MVIGILQVALSIEHATSLKDKRRVVSSLKDRLHREHMVSVAEVADLDDPRRATLGIAMASGEVAHAQGVLDRILDKLRAQTECVLADHAKEILTGK